MSIVQDLWKNGYIVSADAIELLKALEHKIDFKKLIEYLKQKNLRVVSKDVVKEVTKVQNIYNNKEKKENSNGILKFFNNLQSSTSTVSMELRKKTIQIKQEKKLLTFSNTKKEVVIIENKNKKRYVGEEIELQIDIIKSYSVSNKEITINTWVSYYRARLNKIKSFFKNYSDLSLFVSFDQLKRDMEDVSVAGLVRDKKETKKGLVLVLEETKGSLKIFISKETEKYEEYRSIPLDSVIAAKGKYVSSKKMLFAEQLYYPDIPYGKIKRGEDDVWIAFTGDFQIGNKNFLKKPFERFIKWLQGKYGSEKERELAKKVGYLVITGDLIDGVGIYPNQEKELEILTAEDQYKELEKYLLQIPEFIQVAIIPGNHDVVRLAEPQPPIPEEFLPETYKLDNFYYLSNPSYIKIHNLLTVLIYHGYSMDWFVSEIPIIRERGGYEKPGEIMKFMLMVRHLAPTHGSNPYVPYPNYDPLVIDPIPDIFVTGHIHRTSYSVYKGVELINASCFQDITPYQLELGHKPDPGKVILRNIKTGEVKILNFLNST